MLWGSRIALPDDGCAGCHKVILAALDRYESWDWQDRPPIERLAYLVHVAHKVLCHDAMRDAFLTWVQWKATA